MKYLCIVLITFLVSCKTSETIKTSNIAVVNETWITEPSFLINCMVAYPFVSNALSQVANNTNLIGPGDSVSQINLIGRNDFLKVTDNIVEADISYYGTQQFGNVNVRNNGIITNDPLENYQVTYNEKKDQKEISFSVSNDLEHYDFNITVYPSGKCNIEVNSSRRNFIRYDGTLEEFAAE